MSISPTRRWLALGAVVTLGAVAAACGSDDGTGNDSPAPSESDAASPNDTSGAAPDGDALIVGMLMAFSGPTSIEGDEAVNGCLPAQQVINDAGGVLGQPISCEAFDTRGTPTDGVTAARQMLATTPNLIHTIGPSTAEAAAVAPILGEEQIVMISPAGDGRFDTNEDPFYYRLTTSDSIGALAQALYVSEQGYENFASVFVSGASAQANIPPLRAGAELLDLEMVEDLTIQPEQPSYQSEVARLVAADPDVIIFEADPVTAATLLAELRASGGDHIPLITNVLATTGEWQEAVLDAYGEDLFEQNMIPVIRYSDTTGAGNQVFLETLQGLDGSDGIDFASFSESVYSRSFFDGVHAVALAITVAGSTDPAVFNEHIVPILSADDGDTVVTNYADALAALERGESIHWVGASGELRLNQHNNVLGQFASYRWNRDAGLFEQVELLDADALGELSVG